MTQEHYRPIGQILKQVRLDKNITLEEISKTLRISKDYLTALEEGDFQSLPPLSFSTGFLRSYAKYLDQDQDHAVSAFQQECKGELEPHTMGMTFDPLSSSAKPTWRILGLSALLLMTLFAIKFFWEPVSKFWTQNNVESH